MEIEYRWFSWPEFLEVVRRSDPGRHKAVIALAFLNYKARPDVEKLVLCDVLFLRIPWI